MRPLPPDDARGPGDTDPHFDGIPPEQLPDPGPLPDPEPPAAAPPAETPAPETTPSTPVPDPAAQPAEAPAGGEAEATEAEATETAAPEAEAAETAAPEAASPEAAGAAAPEAAAPKAAVPEATAEYPVLEAEPDGRADRQTAVASVPPPGWGPKRPPPEGDPEPAPKPKRYWWRFALAAVLIIATTAGATSASILLWLGDIADALSHNDRLKNQVDRYLAGVQGGEPENILILGSDKRASMPGDPGRSDTTILLRLDPGRNAIAVMSIPRDLKVDIPGVGTGKFNEAYTYGGPKLTLRVVKQLTGLPINHVVNVDFLGFVRAVDAIDCVYTDVDRRYYHSNVGVPANLQYAEIDIQPGYQLLCGKKALQYVRYRHTDTDIVRAARQQDFLSAARQRVPVSKLVPPGQSDLMHIFTEYTTSDIGSTETMLQVLKLFIASRNSAIKEVHFPAVLGPSYVYASPNAIQAAVDKFLGIRASGGPRGSLDEGARHHKAKKARKHAKRKRRLVRAKPPGDDGLTAARDSGLLEAKTVARQVGPAFPVFFPTRLPPGAGFVESSSYYHVVDPRVYHLKDTKGRRHGAYRMVLAMSLPDGTHYFGVQGIQGWSDPPALSNPSLTKTIKGREYEIFVDGDRVKMVAWHRGDNTYWISNSLLQVLTNDQMIGIARSAQAIVPNPKPRKGSRLR